MRNPFVRPETMPQWLLGSVCWAVACVGGWLLWVTRYPPEPCGSWVSLLIAGLLQITLWFKAVPIGRLRGAVGVGPWAQLAGTWRLLLVLALLLTLFLTANDLFLRWLCLSWPSSN